VGYPLPDGRYVDDENKIHKNYNDAAAAATTRQRRAETEAELSRQRQLQLNAANKLEQGRLGKQFLGWVPGVGALQDRRMAEDAREKARADLAVNALQKQLAIHKGQMGEAPMPGAVQPVAEPKVNPPAPFLGAPVAYGDPAARAREAEQRRMMQQYASKEYWDTEQGKAMKDLAMQDRYEGKDLAKFYQAQQATGTGSIDEIVSAMGYTGDMEKWARANQGLALREYLKKYPKGFSNDPAMGALPQGYENNLATYEAHGAPQISVDQLMQGQVEQARQKGYSDEQILAQLKAPQMGLPIGNEPGAIAAVNHEKMQQLQGIIPQTAATGAGEGAFNMQPQSAGTVNTAYAPSQPLVTGNIPAPLAGSGTEAEQANLLAQAYKKRLQDGFTSR